MTDFRPATRRSAMILLVLGFFTVSLFMPAVSAAVAAPDSPEVRDALGRLVPPAMAGPVVADGTLGPLPSTTDADVSFETLDVESDYGPETYKSDYVFNTRTPDELENQTTNWDNALGHRISFTVEVDDGRAELDCDDRFVAIAVIETTHGPVYGWTNGTFDTQAPGGLEDVCPGLPGVRIYEMVFDLDGTPPTITGTAFPALLSGFYMARLELYHHEPSPTDPGGMGPLAGVHEIGFALQDPRLSLDPPLYRFPERMLRMISDTGGHASHTHNFAMPASLLRDTDTWNLTMEFGAQEGTPFTRLDHFATRTLPGVQLPLDPGSTIGETPLDPLLDKVQNQVDQELTGVEIHRSEYDLGSVPASRTMSMELTIADFPTRSELLVDYVPLHVVTILVPATMDTFTTGAESIVVPVSQREFPLRGLSIENDVPIAPTTRVLFQDSDKVTGGPLNVVAGDLFALRPVGSGHEMITRTQLERGPDSQWVEGDLLHLDFSEDTPRYRIVAMMYGSVDEFLGMRVLERGISVEAESARLVEGTSGSLRLRVHHLDVGLDGGDVREGIEATIVIRAQDLPGGGTYNHNITLQAGSSGTVDVPLQGATPGVYPVKVSASHGEIVARTEAPVEVISVEQARAEDRRWYQIPFVEPLVLMLALISVVALVRARRDA